jgi:hypothetical protein
MLEILRFIVLTESVKSQLPITQNICSVLHFDLADKSTVLHA